MKYYRIRPEFLPLWGEDATTETVLTQKDINRFASDWEKPVKELMQQVERINIDFYKGYGDIQMLRTTKVTAIIRKKLYCIVCIQEKEPAGMYYNLYIESFNHEYPLTYMFGVPCNEEDYLDEIKTIEMAIKEAEKNLDIYTRNWF